jgi:hypothetical protein
MTVPPEREMALAARGRQETGQESTPQGIWADRSINCELGRHLALWRLSFRYPIICANGRVWADRV